MTLAFENIEDYSGRSFKFLVLGMNILLNATISSKNILQNLRARQKPAFEKFFEVERLKDNEEILCNQVFSGSQKCARNT